jgi:hypothetical protein
MGAMAFSMSIGVDIRVLVLQLTFDRGLWTFWLAFWMVAVVVVVVVGIVMAMVVEDIW